MQTFIKIPYCGMILTVWFLITGSTPSKSTALRKTITPAGSPLLHNVLHKAVRRSAHGPSPLLQEGERGSRGPSPLLQDITRASPMTIGTPKTGTQRRSSVTTLFSQTTDNNVESNPEETTTTDKMSSTPAEQSSTRYIKSGVTDHWIKLNL